MCTSELELLASTEMLLLGPKSLLGASMCSEDDVHTSSIRLLYAVIGVVWRNEPLLRLGFPALVPADLFSLEVVTNLVRLHSRLDFCSHLTN